MLMLQRRRQAHLGHSKKQKARIFAKTKKKEDVKCYSSILSSELIDGNFM